MILLLSSVTYADDKELHLITGMAVQSAGQMMGLGTVNTFRTLVIISVTKELFDHYTKTGDPDLQDVGATMLGGFMVRKDIDF